MANRATQSLTTGMKILGGANIPTYTLEYLTPTGRHKTGSFETVVVPYIELGRDKSCGVQFGDDTPTVSRKHCAIERKGNETFVINLSKSNPTLINGRPVTDRFFLNNGDEIQLSVEGPRLRFNTTKSGTAKIGFTNKMNLVIQQAIKPYKMVATAFLSMFLLLAAGAGTAIYQLNKQVDDTLAQLVVQGEISQAQAETIRALNSANDDLTASFSATQRQLEQDRVRMAAEARALAAELAAVKSRSDSLLANATMGGAINFADVIEPLKPFVLGLIWERITIERGGQIVYDEPAQDDPSVGCTGFLVESGLFVTARHCYDMFDDYDALNFYDNRRDMKVTLTFLARNYDNSISFRFTQNDMTADFSRDQLMQVTYEGETGIMREPDYFNGTDWAYMQTSFTGGPPMDPAMSLAMRNGTDLFVLGYSYGERHRSSGNLEPYFSTAKVALSGIEEGMIQVTEAGWDGGNSGGPVYTLVNGTPTVIGLVTGVYNRNVRSVGGDLVILGGNIKVVTPLGNME